MKVLISFLKSTRKIALEKVYSKTGYFYSKINIGRQHCVEEATYLHFLILRRDTTCYSDLISDIVSDLLSDSLVMDSSFENLESSVGVATLFVNELPPAPAPSVTQQPLFGFPKWMTCPHLSQAHLSCWVTNLHLPALLHLWPHLDLGLFRHATTLVLHSCLVAIWGGFCTLPWLAPCFFFCCQSCHGALGITFTISIQASSRWMVSLPHQSCLWSGCWAVSVHSSWHPLQTAGCIGERPC